MKQVVNSKYYWKPMGKDIADAINKCNICLLSGEELINTKNRAIEIYSQNELWEIDLMGRIVNKRTNKFIFVQLIIIQNG
ncbi:hypothetical protein H312_02267 [Anncaliia algerae PRA339]|uniref:Integrase zinc-binding domain-containing protein n=1 Tax=Anncaliia algerae PRA339 TaxID=1288291 RepID=A0A059EZH9_9MICR|nr:hypothetical protein H312_02267 [Anncaliia algerae PRA339]